MPSKATSHTLSAWEARYDPRQVLDHPEFAVIPPGDKRLQDRNRNISCSYNGEGEMRMINKPMPEPGPGEVLLHVRATGICGSDVHFWKHGRIGNNVLHEECGAGHESAGEVVALGEGVTDFAVGDRVAIEAGIPCGQPDCKPCIRGRYNACPRMVFHSSPPYHGTLTRFHAHPTAWLHRLPDSVSFEEGALCEPLSVALAGVEKAGVRLGDPVLICGAGPIGAMSLLAAHASGCYPIVITDLEPSRLGFAKSLVPTVRTVQVQREWDAETTAEAIRKAAVKDLSCALECTGFESSITAACYSVEFGGKVFVIGLGPSVQKYPFAHCSLNEIDLQFLFRYAHQYPKALSLIEGGLINVKPLVTHKFPLERAVEAFAVAADPKQGAVKVQIVD